MRMKILFSLCALFFIVPNSLSKGVADKGFSGSIGFVYNEDNNKANEDEVTVQTFSQNYLLNYGGYLYSPSLLDYSLQGGYTESNVDSELYNNSFKSENKDYSYGASMNFIKNTKYPFSISSSKRESPIGNISNGTLKYTTNEEETKQINGSMDFGKLDFTYSIYSLLSSFSYDENTTTERELNSYNANMTYVNEEHSVNIMYLDTEQKNKTDSVIPLAGSNDIMYSALLLAHNWKINKSLNYDFSINITEDESGVDTKKRTDAEMRLRWRPKEKYRGSVEAFVSSNDSFDMYNISNTFTYNIMPTLTINQYANYNKSSYAQTETEAINLALFVAHDYRKEFYKNIKLIIATNLNFQSNNNKTVKLLENNSTNSSENIYAFNTDARISKSNKIEIINSVFNVGANYRYMIDSKKTTVQSYNFDTSLSTRLLSFVQNTINANYSQIDTSIAEVGGGLEKKSNTIKRIIEDLRVFYASKYRLGIHGIYSFKANANYIYRVNQNSFNKYTNSIFSQDIQTALFYRLTGRLSYEIRASARNTAGVMNYGGSAELKFLAGKTSFIMSYKYNNIQYDTTAEKTKNEQTTINATLTRKF